MPSYGAAPHNNHNPKFGGDQISQSEAQQLARKLAKKDETIQHLSERNQELNAEVEQLRKQRDTYEKGLHDVRARASKMLEDTHAYGGLFSIKEAAEDALDDRGDADA